MSVNKSWDVISHQLFLHNETDTTTIIFYGGGESQGDKGERKRERIRRRNKCQEEE